MLRLMIFSTAITFAAIGAAPQPAAAQWLNPHLDSQRWSNLNKHQQRMKKKNGSWAVHVRKCQRAYRSYNPRTDRYLVRPGVWARCRL